MALDLFKGSSYKDEQGPPGPDRAVKNYFFIYDREHPQIDLLRYKSSRGQEYYGKLFLSIAALQEIFIGSGEIDKKDKHLYDVFSYVRTGRDQWTWNIPGSSLKGCIYTHLAMFLQNYGFFQCEGGAGQSVLFRSPYSRGS